LSAAFFCEKKYLRFMQNSTSFTIQEAQKKLEHYCAYQERCHQEVIQKLRGMNMIPEAIEIIISQLIEDNYLNETRFAQSFARGKFRIKKWGKERIVRELKFRKISPFNIKIALKEASLLSDSGKQIQPKTSTCVKRK
jgi:regulatory protein